VTYQFHHCLLFLVKEIREEKDGKCKLQNEKCKMQAQDAIVITDGVTVNIP